ncbi:HAD family hydrolase [Marinicrinis sediminis]|uniref:HAD family hydrolase n=1 Tax=Marinicrinis sediminis TaxID=1652465 RepID=A0ABW5RAA5_9BACL
MCAQQLLRNKKVLFFDVMGTLIDPEKTFEHALKDSYEDFTARLDGAMSSSDFMNAYRKRYTRFSQRYRSKKKQNRSASANQKRAAHAQPVTKRQLRLRTLHALLSSSSLPFDASSREAFVQYVRKNQRHHYTLYPDVAKTFDQLAKRYTICLISNSHPISVEQLGLHSWVLSTRVFTAKQSGFRKPAREMYQYALKKSGYHAADAVMIGDSKRNDIFGATRAGIDAIWIQREDRQAGGKEGDKKKRTKKIGNEHIVIVRTLSALLDWL